MKSFIIGYSDGDRSRDNVIGIAICYGLDSPGSSSGRSTNVITMKSFIIGYSDGDRSRDNVSYQYSDLLRAGQSGFEFR